MLSVVEKDLVYHLEQRAMTLKELADEAEMNYYTVRKLVLPLVEAGYVEKLGNYQRNVKYRAAIDPETAPNKIIPELTYGDNKYKSIYFLKYDPRTSKTLKSEQAFIYALFQLFELVEEVNADPNFDAEYKIRQLRIVMKQNLNQIRNFVKMGDEILDNNRFWEQPMLKKFNLDPDWNPHLIAEARQIWNKLREEG